MYEIVFSFILAESTLYMVSHFSKKSKGEVLYLNESLQISADFYSFVAFWTVFWRKTSNARTVAAEAADSEPRKLRP